MVISIAKARTKETYLLRLALLREVKEKAADWIDERREQFATYCFLDRGKRRFGKVTSNGVENLNGIILGLREKPIYDLTLGLLTRSIVQQHKRVQEGKAWQTSGQELVEHADCMRVSTMSHARTRRVVVTFQEGDLYKALVSHRGSDSRSTVTVEVNAITYQICCPCDWTREMGAPCVHAMALIINKSLEPSDKRWYDNIYHTSTYCRMYAMEPPDLSSVNRLTVTDIIPPEHKRTTGRPKSKRKNRDFYRASANSHSCHGCGVVGHHMSTCQNPNTQFRYEMFHKEALKWANGQLVKPDSIG